MMPCQLHNHHARAESLAAVFSKIRCPGNANSPARRCSTPGRDRISPEDRASCKISAINSPEVLLSVAGPDIYGSDNMASWTRIHTP